MELAVGGRTGRTDTPDEFVELVETSSAGCKGLGLGGLTDELQRSRQSNQGHAIIGPGRISLLKPSDRGATVLAQQGEAAAKLGQMRVGGRSLRQEPLGEFEISSIDGNPNEHGTGYGIGFRDLLHQALGLVRSTESYQPLGESTAGRPVFGVGCNHLA